jgi:hypothetical protein
MGSGGLVLIAVYSVLPLGVKNIRLTKRINHSMGVVHGKAVDSAAIVCSYILASGFLRVRTCTVIELISNLLLPPGILWWCIVGIMCIFLY